MRCRKDSAARAAGSSFGHRFSCHLPRSASSPCSGARGRSSAGPSACSPWRRTARHCSSPPDHRPRTGSPPPPLSGGRAPPDRAWRWRAPTALPAAPAPRVRSGTVWPSPGSPSTVRPKNFLSALMFAHAATISPKRVLRSFIIDHRSRYESDIALAGDDAKPILAKR